MLNEFRGFLIRSNALALAIGVIFGAAAGKIVSGLVEDLLMPIISLVLPGGNWEESKILLGTKTVDGKTVVNAIKYGHFFGNVIDFIVIAFVLFLIVKNFVKDAMPPVTKECPFCKEQIAPAATKCKFCGSAV